MTPTRQVRIKLHSLKGPTTEGSAEVRSWTPGQAFSRGFKIALKIVGIALLLMLPHALLEPFLFMLWGSFVGVFLFTLIGPLLHLHFASQRETIENMSAPCPDCEKLQTLTPYTSAAFKPQFKSHCSACGAISITYVD